MASLSCRVYQPYSAYGTRVADVPANLFSVPASCEVTNANSGPAKLSHQGRKVPVSACSTLALLHPQNIQQRLRADAFQPINADLSAHALQAQAPRVYGLRGFGCGRS